MLEIEYALKRTRLEVGEYEYRKGDNTLGVLGRMSLKKEIRTTCGTSSLEQGVSKDYTQPLVCR